MSNHERARADSLDKQFRKTENTSLLAWEEVTLGSQLDAIIGGGTPSRSRADYWADGDIPWITVKDMVSHRITGTQEKITEAGLNNSSANLIPPNTVIVATRMAVGRTTRSTVPAAINQDLKALFPKSTLMPEYLHLVMRRAQPILESQASGSTVKGIRLQNLKDYRFYLPSIPEQKGIVEIIQGWEEALLLIKELIAAQRERKRGLMQVLLTGKKRFKEFEGQEWPVVRFDDVLKVDIGGTPARKEPSYWDRESKSANHWVSIADITGKYLSGTKERITDLGVQKSSTKLVPAGTVIMSFKLTIGRAAILKLPMYTNEAICSLVPKRHGSIDTEYLYYALAVVDFEQELDQAVKGRTLNKSKLNRLKLNLPSIDEQKRIAAVLSTADQEIENLEKQLEAYKLQKRGLLQQLLTGKKRVNIDKLEPVAT